MATYTLQAGRSILRDGEPFANIQASAGEYVSPTDLDEFARNVVDCVNEEYNGWSNRETWALALHVDNTEAWQRMRREWANVATRWAETDKILDKPEYHLTRMLKEWAEDAFERVYHEPENASKDERMMACDVGSLWRVDYREIARVWLSE